jgi:hypothetical protein
MVRTALAALAAIVFGCYAGNEVRSASVPNARTLITRTELQQVAAVDLLEAVRSLRPLWLMARAGGGRGALVPAGPRIVVDNVPYGGRERLRELPLDHVVAVRFISGIDATTRWGTGVPFGVIEVITASRR